jgi:hypothetical protein
VRDLSSNKMNEGTKRSWDRFGGVFPLTPYQSCAPKADDVAVGYGLEILTPLCFTVKLWY